MNIRALTRLLRLSFLLFFLFSNILLANDSPALLVCTESDPDAFIEETVNVINGEYCESVIDLSITAPSPLLLQRFYTNRDYLTNTHLGGWRIFPERFLVVGEDRQNPSYHRAFTGGRSGGLFSYFGQISQKEFPQTSLKIQIYQEAIGMCNTYANEISGQTNHQNEHLYCQGSTCELILGEGTRRLYEQVHNLPSDILGEQLVPLMAAQVSEPKYYKLTREILPNGNHLLFSYTAKGHLACIKMNNSTDGKTLAWIEFSYLFESSKCIVEITTSEEKTVQYYFDREKDHYWLTEVKGSHLIPISYEYQNGLTKSILPEGRYKEIEYYVDGRVKALKTPDPIHGVSSITHSFYYAPNYTEVSNALNILTVYQYNSRKELTTVTKYDDQKEPYRIDRKYFGKTQMDSGLLLAKTTEDATGKVHSYKSFTYDSKGNIKQERLYGNLTGNPDVLLEVSSDGILLNPNEHECFLKNFEYSKDDFNLVTQVKDCKGNATCFGYKSKTNLLTKKILCSNTRYFDYEDDDNPNAHEPKSFFYSYNEDASCIKIIEDDGWSKEENDTFFLSKRKTTSILPKDTFPGIGLPLIIEEKVFDYSKKKETFIRKQVRSYDNQGLCISLDTYGSDGLYAFSEQWRYNHLGLMTTKTDATCKITEQCYDSLGNLTYISIPHENKTISFFYNLRNEPTSSVESRGEGVFTSQSDYDLLGNKTSSTDYFGNTTTYDYDFCNRIVKTIHPKVLNEKGKTACPIFSYTYDLFDHVSSLTDPKGHTVYTSRNLRGDPVKVTYPDGTFELFKYDPEGSLHRSLSREKIITVYEYDHLGRKTYEEVSKAGPNGIEFFLYGHVYEYNASHCIKEEMKYAYEEDCSLTKEYKYDAAGHLLREDQRGSRAALRRMEMQYDALSRMKQKKTWFAEGAKDYTAECFTYDLLGNVLEKQVLDSKGSIFLKKSFSYNERGQSISEYEGDQQTPLLQTIYDDHLEPKAYVDALGNKTQVIANYAYLNSLGQTVLKKTMTNPLGVLVEMEFDALQRVHTIAKKDANGHLLSFQKNLYDLIGNLCQEIHDEIIEGKTISSKIIKRTYGPMGRIEEEIEAAGSLEEKKTLFFYNSLGQVKKKTTQDISTYYWYTNQGMIRKIEVHNSDKKVEISNTYKYDVHGNVISAKGLNGVEVTRNYDGFNRLIFEHISVDYEQYQLHFSYDQKDRLTSITFPDRSKAVYTYDAAFGKKIERFSSKGKLLYFHSNDSYDKQGRLLEESFILNLGTQKHLYDLCSNKTALLSDFYTEHCKKDALGRTYEKLTKEGLSTYAYNDLSQLILEQKNTPQVFSYDSLNRLLKTSESTFSYNSLDQLLKISNRNSTNMELCYDLRGNLIKKTVPGKETSFTSNLLNQLISIKTSKLLHNFSYDPFGRIIKKTSLDGSGKEVLSIRYFYVGSEEIGSLGKNNSIRTLKIPGVNGSNLSQKAIAFELHDKLHLPIYDLAGNVVCLIDPYTKSVIERYEYTAFGEATIYNRYDQKESLSSVDNSWRFAGKRVQAGLVYFGFRFYDPEIGRWTSPDPAGFIDGINLYAYLHNNPLNYFDRFGLASESQNAFDGYFYGEVESHCYCETHRTCKRGGNTSAFNTFDLPTITYDDHFESKYIQDYFNPIRPYYEPSKIFDLSDLEITDSQDVGIGWINGVDNTYKESRESALYLSRLAKGHNIHAVYNASHGVSNDLKECRIGLKYTATTPVRLLHKLWNDFFNRSSEEANFLMICHSQGAIHVRNALLDYPPNLRSRVSVVAVAPAAYIYQDSCAMARHYRASSRRDPIPRIDQSGSEREADTIIELTSDPGAPLFDHPIKSPTYKDPLLTDINSYIQSKKGIKK